MFYKIREQKEIFSGCFISHENHVYVGRDSCRFIERLTEQNLHDKFRADQPTPPPPSANSSSKSSTKNATTSPKVLQKVNCQ